MAKCKFCGKHVVSGSVVHDECLPRWIPVTERLPEKAGVYLVAYHHCYWDNVHEETCVGIDTFRGKTTWAQKKYKRVTHWMPLPTPPEEA